MWRFLGAERIGESTALMRSCARRWREACFLDTGRFGNGRRLGEALAFRAGWRQYALVGAEDASECTRGRGRVGARRFSCLSLEGIFAEIPEITSKSVDSLESVSEGVGSWGSRRTRKRSVNLRFLSASLRRFGRASQRLCQAARWRQKTIWRQSVVLLRLVLSASESARKPARFPWFCGSPRIFRLVRIFAFRSHQVPPPARNLFYPNLPVICADSR